MFAFPGAKIFLVAAGGVLLFLLIVRELRKPPKPPRVVTTRSGTKFAMLPPRFLGTIYEVSYETAVLDDSDVTQAATELLPIFAPEAEHEGSAQLDIVAVKVLARGKFVTRSERNVRMFVRGDDGHWRHIEGE